MYLWKSVAHAALFSFHIGVVNKTSSKGENLWKKRKLNRKICEEQLIATSLRLQSLMHSRKIGKNLE